MEITLVKTLSGSLRPAYDSDYEKLKKLPVNEPVQFKYTKQRNYKFHKKFFALVNMVFENQERYTNIEHLRRDLIVAAGYYDVRNNFDGVEIYEPKSISFASMDENEFSELYSAVIDVIVKYFHFDRQDIIEQVEQFF